MKDTIDLASELGRLDFVSAILRSIAIILALGGIFTFLNLRSIAKSRAESVAKDIAGNVAEQVPLISEQNSIGLSVYRTQESRY